jgi:pSer/pThr/pTyr-binding forkhead associated (FHA) protein
MEGVVVARKKIARRGGGTAVLKPKPRRKPRKPGGRSASITITNGCFAGLEIPLRKQCTTLGRAVSCDICLDHAFVSEEHAVVRRSNGGFVIEDLNSRHGTSVNGKEIHTSPLKRGDKVSIGTFELKFTC